MCNILCGLICLIWSVLTWPPATGPGLLFAADPTRILNQMQNHHQTQVFNQAQNHHQTQLFNAQNHHRTQNFNEQNRHQTQILYAQNQHQKQILNQAQNHHRVKLAFRCTEVSNARYSNIFSKPTTQRTNWKPPNQQKWSCFVPINFRYMLQKSETFGLWRLGATYKSLYCLSSYLQ